MRDVQLLRWNRRLKTASNIEPFSLETAAARVHRKSHERLFEKHNRGSKGSYRRGREAWSGGEHGNTRGERGEKCQVVTEDIRFLGTLTGEGRSGTGSTERNQRTSMIGMTSVRGGRGEEGEVGQRWGVGTTVGGGRKREARTSGRKKATTEWKLAVMLFFPFSLFVSPWVARVSPVRSSNQDAGITPRLTERELVRFWMGDAPATPCWILDPMIIQ